MNITTESKVALELPQRICQKYRKLPRNVMPSIIIPQSDKYNDRAVLYIKKLCSASYSFVQKYLNLAGTLRCTDTERITQPSPFSLPISAQTARFQHASFGKREVEKFSLLHTAAAQTRKEKNNDTSVLQKSNS